ncbi:MAG: tRNA (guanosine(46)-N7)-methyltransferase TrmB [Mycoplasmatales bacterium]
MRVKHKPWAKDYKEQSTSFINKEDITSDLFINDNPVHLELGMGKGEFLITLAKQNPNINYIGIEVQLSAQVMAAKKLEDENLENIKLLNIDVKDLLEIEYLVNNIDVIYLNFSDPWPKNRHAKRRLTHINFLNIYNDLLSDDGIIKFKTDNDILFESSIENISLSNFIIEQVILDLHSHQEIENIQTEYEKKFSQKGFKIKLIRLKKGK